MQKKIRPDPLIPDHEVLRKIGGGAYGEVWLARGVTGALRAVKVVYREDFSDERTFEREFEGILRFEPISRDHQGFVNILHVGRSGSDAEFYYYVMELGDDAHGDGEINPVEYEPRTLRTDMKKVEGEPLDTDFCVTTGRRLAEALAQLHHHGLTHRDVKPSNVIFVDGKAKLADIGLVASKDQRTFVGTEGFVPPEGPGSEQADIYSLGKVLYEMATGMDRLQFPELPEEGPGADSRKKWIRLNQVVCDICEPRISKRKIRSGEELAHALGRLEAGRRLTRKFPRYALAATLVLGILAFCFTHIFWLERGKGTYVIEAIPKEERFVTVKIFSEPEGARVFDEDDLMIDVTPVTLLDQMVGSELTLTITSPGYRDLEIVEKIPAGEGGIHLIPVTLGKFAPPVEGREWLDALGNKYWPTEEGHQAGDHVSENDWKVFLDETGRKFNAESFEHSGRKVVAVEESWAQEYTTWLMEKCIADDKFERYSDDDPASNRQIVADFDRRFPENKLPSGARRGNNLLRPFYCVVKAIEYGSIEIRSQPPGATVYINGIQMGPTPYFDDNVAPGLIEFTLELAGTRGFSDSEYLKDGGKIFRNIPLAPDDETFTPGKPWTNSLQMKLVPYDDDLMVAVWETRSRDFTAYLKATDQSGNDIEISKDGNVPVAAVTREECLEFCEWLTQKERGDRITQEYRYRLPTDEEWSAIVGISEFGDSPADREIEPQNSEIYPWGNEWPPPEGAGNYADLSSADTVGPDNYLASYVDNFPMLAPVGEFEANELGVYDMGGNVWEWVLDVYPGRDGKLGINRGGSCNSHSRTHLESRIRYPTMINLRRFNTGFRVVLAKIQEDEEEIDEPEEPEESENPGEIVGSPVSE